MNQIDFIQRLAEGPGRYSWFLGAGASHSAGLPSAIDVIWDLKRREYCLKENQEISANDLQNPAIREKIESYMTSHGFPGTYEAEAYSQSFALIFGDNRERQRRYVAAMLSEERSSLTQGHRVLGALLTMGFVRAAFTTNFDTVVERSVAEIGGKAIAPFHLEGTYAAKAALNNDEFPLYVKLHGDFRYESLKNLSADLATQNQELGDCFVAAATRFGCVVAGYSGRDESVMSLIERALDGANAFPHGLLWTGLKGRSPLPRVRQLLDKARSKGVTAEYIEIETYDSLLSRVWKQIPNRPPALVDKVGRAGAQGIAIPLAAEGKGRPLLRLSALPLVKLPQQCFRLEASRPLEWEDLEKAEKSGQDVACTKGADVWAWGSEASLRIAFGADVTIQAVTPGAALSDLDTMPPLKSFLERGLGFALKRDKPLLVRKWRGGSVLILDGKNLKVENATGLKKAVGGALFGDVPGIKSLATEHHAGGDQVRFAEALRIEVDYFDGRHWLVLRPDVWIWPRASRELATGFLDERTKKRFNEQALQLLSAWLEFLFPSRGRGDLTLHAFDGADGPGNPSFTLNSRTAFSRRLTT